jgi:hypothetical protein
VIDTPNKAKNPHDTGVDTKSQDVNLVDTVSEPSLVEHGAIKEVFGVKRTGSEAVDITVPQKVGQLLYAKKGFQCFPILNISSYKQLITL